MGTTEFGDIHYPPGGNDAVVAAHLMQMATDMDKIGAFTVQDAADRDARFSDLPAGRMVASKTTVWLKASDPADAPKWLPVFSDTGVLTTGVVQASSTSPITLDSQWGRIRNGHVSVRAVFTWNGGPITATANGNITNTQLGSVLGRFVPPYTSLGIYSIPAMNGGAYVSPGSGALWIKDALPNAVIPTGATISANFEFAENA